MIEYTELSFKKNKLYHGKKKTGISIFEDQKDQWRIRFEDLSFSPDFYNLTRVKDNAKKYYQRYINNTTEVDVAEAADAF